MNDDTIALKNIEDMNKADIAAEIKRITARQSQIASELDRLYEVLEALKILHEKMDDPSAPPAKGRTSPQKKRGQVTKEAFGVVAASSTPMTSREVVNALAAAGFRSAGQQKNFIVSVSKALRGMVKHGKIKEHRAESGRVSYSVTKAQTP